MKKIALGSALAVMLCTFSGCAVTGGTFFLAAVAMAAAGVALFIYGGVRAVQRAKFVRRSRRSSGRGLKKADRLTVAVFVAATLLFAVGSMLLVANLAPLILANQTPTEDTTPQIEYEERTLPWKTFPPDQPIASEKYFVYSCNDNTFLRSTVDENATFQPMDFTKLFTTYVAMEYIKPAGSIRITEEMLAAVPAGAKTAGFIANQSTTAKVLVEAVIVADATDAAYILAVYIGTSLLDDPTTAEIEEVPTHEAIARFVQEMNTKAKEAGMTSTTFVNPDGAVAEGQKTNITDLITMTRLLAKVETILEYTSTGKDTVSLSNTASFVWINSNELVDSDSEFYCPYAEGMKLTPFGNGAYNLLTLFKSNGKTFIIGVLNETDTEVIYTDVLHLFNLTMGLY